MEELTPRQIVQALDKHIIGQQDAKRAVAVAIRNRWRRQQLDADIGAEVYPKNIVMAGPTGCGKTEIARRLAKLTGAPFIKVEASKFTEVGYHGRDVESMIRDLLDQGIATIRAEQATTVKEKAEELAIDRLVQLLLPAPGPTATSPRPDERAPETEEPLGGWVSTDKSTEARDRLRQRIREQVQAGAMDEKEVELTLTSRPQTSVMFANMGLDQMDPSMSDMFEKLIPEQNKRKRVKVSDAKRILIEQETEKLLDEDKIVSEAIERTQQSGIVFLDEIDKIATPEGAAGGQEFAGRLATGCAARSLADRRRLGRQHASRHHPHGPHPFHRGGRVSLRQGQRLDARVTGSLPDSRRTATFDEGRFCPHLDRAQRRADDAAAGATRCRRLGCRLRT